MRRSPQIKVELDRTGIEVGPAGSTAIVTVLIAEDDPLIRETLATVIDGDDNFVVTAMTADAEAAIIAAIEEPPDLALLDVRMPGGGGAHAAMKIAEACPDVHIVAISAHDDKETIGEMIEAGARGYITKDGPAHQMLDTLRRCAAGESVFTPRSATNLMQQYVKSSQRMEAAKKRLREREIRMREACDPRSINSVFQPIVDLESGEVVIYEALTRFNCGHELNTAEWFEEAVHLGMSAELEIAALARTVAALVEQGDPSVKVSVNVSPDTLLSPALMATLAPIDLSRVVVEITEHAQIYDYEQTKAVFKRLRATERGWRSTTPAPVRKLATHPRPDARHHQARHQSRTGNRQRPAAAGASGRFDQLRQRDRRRDRGRGHRDRRRAGVPARAGSAPWSG